MFSLEMFGLRFSSKSIAFVLLLALAAVAQSAGAEASSSNLDAPAFVAASPRDTPRWQALVAKAQAKGSVRVIVGLRTSFLPEGRLRGPQAVRAQRSSIAQAQSTLLNRMANRNVKAVRKFASIPHLVVEVDADALAALGSAPDVTSIEEDRRRRPSLMESVPLIGAPNAWANGHTGAGQVVAILDTGVDKTHPFLSPRVVAEACYSTNYLPDTATSLCPGGVSQSTDPGSGLNCTVVGICIHGTHVAGIAAGRDNGSIGFSGVAKDAGIISIQVYSYFTDIGEIQAYDSDILAGLEYLQTLSGTYSIAAANLSLGGEPYTTQAACDAKYPAYKEMIANLDSLGIATVIAAGNDYSSNSISTPACASGAVSVGSTLDGTWGTTADTVSSFSDSAAFLTLLAPGQYIYSSIPGGGFATMMGTSMAAPHVAGAWAVLKSARPSATVNQTLTAIFATGKSITDPRNGITKPRIQLDAAANLLVDLRIYFFPMVAK